MGSIAQGVFWISVALITYVYCGYPVVLWIISRIARPLVSPKLRAQPTVSILISAYNEADHIVATVRNKLQQSYPLEKLEVIVTSDGSVDETDSLLREMEHPAVRVVRQEPRQGKTLALNRMAEIARGDILAFSDANSLWSLDAVAKLAENFASSDVGYVSGRMIYVDETDSPIGGGCDAYMRYENWIRELETNVGSIVGVDGGIDAMRKELYRPMRPEQLPDFVLPLSVIEQGFRVVYESRAMLREASLTKATDEYRMRVRVTLRAMWALRDMKRLFDMRISGGFAWQLASHKLLRYLVYVPATCALLTSAVLAFHSMFFVWMLALQSVFYILGSASLVLPKRVAALRLFAWPGYFLVLNAACAHASWRFISGERITLWQPRTG